MTENLTEIIASRMVNNWFCSLIDLRARTSLLLSSNRSRIFWHSWRIFDKWMYLNSIFSFSIRIDSIDSLLLFRIIQIHLGQSIFIDITDICPFLFNFFFKFTKRKTMSSKNFLWTWLNFNWLIRCWINWLIIEDKSFRLIVWSNFSLERPFGWIKSLIDPRTKWKNKNSFEEEIWWWKPRSLLLCWFVRRRICSFRCDNWFKSNWICR